MYLCTAIYLPIKKIIDILQSKLTTTDKYHVVSFVILTIENIRFFGILWAIKIVSYSYFLL